MPKVIEKKPILPKVIIEDEPWINRYWRPMMAWQYFVVCICDFIIFPSFAMYYASKYGVAEHFKWEPITLASGGFYHIAMGIIVGVSAYSRGQENILRTRLFAGPMPPPPPPPPEYFDGEGDYMNEGSEPPAHPTSRPRRGG